jgi:hypothetical protein
MEIIETGALRRVDAERTEDVAAVQLFQGIYGVGMYGYEFSLDLFTLSSPPYPRAIDCVCLVLCWLPHA